MTTMTTTTAQPRVLAVRAGVQTCWMPKACSCCARKSLWNCPTASLNAGSAAGTVVESSEDIYENKRDGRSQALSLLFVYWTGTDCTAHRVPRANSRAELVPHHVHERTAWPNSTGCLGATHAPLTGNPPVQYVTGHSAACVPHPPTCGTHHARRTYVIGAGNFSHELRKQLCQHAARAVALRAPTTDDADHGVQDALGWHAVG